MFDSRKEAERYICLNALQQQGRISDLRRQVSFELIPAQYGKKGELLERRCTYKADFTYIDSNGVYHVEDVKGVRTPEYKIKRKLMLEKYNISIEEV